MTPLAKSLNRTLLLMRDEFGPEIADSVLLDALTSTRIPSARGPKCASGWMR